jgi:NTE family protein
VPVDFIAGTSMGAIVGGLYAAGLSPAAIETEMVAADWADLFNDKPPRRDLTYRRKRDDSSDLIDLEMGFKGRRLVLPRGLVAGQKIGVLLQTLALPAAGIDDFDRLAIPFRAVATDIGTGDMVVLAHGSLPQAMRASMSIPGVVAPIEIDGRMLVDGGLVRNLPVDVVRAMGADVVIAVDVSTPLLEPHQVGDLPDITYQVSGMLTHLNIEPQLAAADLVLAPRLDDVSTGAFHLAATAVERGEEAARAPAASLASWALPGDEFARHLRRLRPGPMEPIRVEEVRVDGAPRVDPRILKRRIRTATGGLLDQEALHDDLGRLYDLGDFERVDFEVRRRDAGGAVLVFRAQEKPWGPNFLRFGINFANDFQGNSDFNVLGRLTRTRLNVLGAEWRTDVGFGRTRRLASEWYQPLDFGGTWFVAPAFHYTYWVADIYEGDRSIAEYQARTVVGSVALGAQLGRYGEARAGIVRGDVEARARIGDTGLPEFDIPFGGLFGRLVIDRLDDNNFPHSGRRLVLESFLARDSLGSDVSYDKLAGSFVQVFGRRRHHVFASLQAGTDLGSEIPFYDQFRLGGLFSLSGLREGQVQGQLFGVGRFGWYRRSGRLSGIFGRGIYLGAWFEAGNAWDSTAEISRHDLLYTATLAAGVDTFFGPLYLAYGAAEGGSDAFYLAMGRSFGGPRLFDF